MKELKFSLDDFKFDGISFNELNLFVGNNGSGKSLLNKITWLSHMIANAILIAEEHNFNKEELIKDLIRKTLYDSQIFELDILANFHKGYINIRYSEDKLIFLDYNLENCEITKPNYLSTDTRKFNQITQILNNKALYEKYDRLEDVLVPAYDILFSQIYKETFKDKWVNFNQESINRFKEHYKIDIVALKCNEDNTFSYKNSSGEEKSCFTLSNGEQALLVMMGILSV